MIKKYEVVGLKYLNINLDFFLQLLYKITPADQRSHFQEYDCLITSGAMKIIVPTLDLKFPNIVSGNFSSVNLVANPKSISFSLESSFSDANIKFSGLRSL